MSEAEEEEEGEEGDGWIGLEDHTASRRQGIKDEVVVEVEEGEKGKGKGKRGGIEECVGNTPMIRIGSLSRETGCEVWVKVEVSGIFLFFFGFWLLAFDIFVLVFIFAPGVGMWGGIVWMERNGIG